MRHLFILNKYAGTKDSTTLIRDRINNLNTEESIFIEYTRSPGDAKRIVREYLKNDPDYLRIYTCGGDGTAGEAAQSMIGHNNCALGIIPIGTGNDFVRSLDRDFDQFLDVQKMVDGNVIMVDALKCNDTYAINCVSAGYDCEVADKAQSIKRWPLMNGSLAYKLSIFYCLFTKRKHTFYPVADGKKAELPEGYNTQMLTVTGNGMYYGGGIKCTPLASLSDGYLDFMTIPTISVPRFISLLSMFIKGNHVNNPKFPFITYLKCKKVQLIDDKPLKIGIDGEMNVLENPTIEVVEKALNIILPKDD